MNIHNNIQKIKLAIDQAIKASGRTSPVKLLAITKSRSIDEIKEAIDAGQLYFGESYVQEAISKITALCGFSIEWHFIGPIQANKTKLIANYFSWVHSVDRINIAQRLNDQRTEKTPLNICIQVNISGEATKSGVSLGEIMPLAQAIITLPKIRLRGLMTIPKLTYDIDEQRENFHKLKLALERLNKQGFNLDTLSMGMSSDFISAIPEGATIIRLGKAIFG